MSAFPIAVWNRHDATLERTHSDASSASSSTNVSFDSAINGGKLETLVAPLPSVVGTARLTTLYKVKLLSVS